MKILIFITGLELEIVYKYSNAGRTMLDVTLGGRITLGKNPSRGEIQPYGPNTYLQLDIDLCMRTVLNL